MAINFPNLPRFTPQEGGSLPDLQQAIMQGIGNYMQPKQMAQEFLHRELTNKVLGAQAKFAEPLVQAQIIKALQPNSAMAKLPYEIALLQARTEKAKKPEGGVVAGDRVLLTTGAKTASQKNIGYYRKTLESLNQILALNDDEIPGMASFTSTFPKYLSGIAKAKDQFAKAESFPGTIPGMKASEDVVSKYRSESIDEYRARLGALTKEIGSGLNTELENMTLGMSVKMPKNEPAQSNKSTKIPPTSSPGKNEPAQSNKDVIEYHLVNGRYVPKG